MRTHTRCSHGHDSLTCQFDEAPPKLMACSASEVLLRAVCGEHVRPIVIVFFNISAKRESSQTGKREQDYKREEAYLAASELLTWSLPDFGFTSVAAAWASLMTSSGRFLQICNKLQKYERRSITMHMQHRQKHHDACAAARMLCAAARMLLLACHVLLGTYKHEQACACVRACVGACVCHRVEWSPLSVHIVLDVVTILEVHRIPAQSQ